MAEERTHITTIEGPKGKAEVYELSDTPTGTVTSGVASSTYEIVFGNERQITLTLGEASIVAHELAGAD